MARDPNTGRFLKQEHIRDGDRRRCARCGEFKNSLSFRRMRASELHPWCRECMKPYNTRKSFEYRVRKYDLTADDALEIIAAQGGGCAICGKTEVVEGKRLALDHCHNTGRLRGFLCESCNQGLGKFYDNPAFLVRASEYLGVGRGV